ncbi:MULTISPECIES: hypothetical protein [Lysobacter]|uniref:YecA/YgfB family protein n=1 Tax=Lysobacter TaxID=68 RepID=UPI001F4642BB|nr:MULTISPECIES: hypothetical protein [Lysobacter]UJB19612.1 hypothetical protein L1A79_00490 [Lysobacter capsici]UJQ26662.1 hypothetical protein L2D09_14370 [Lysobacter gummosus]
MLRPITQNAGTTQRERYLAALASSHFFSLWSYPCLSRRAKKGVAKELADLTVIFGDDIVLFSDKDIAWPSHPDIEVAWSRWFRASILESANQLWGAMKHLQGPDPAIFLDAKCETPFPLPVMSERTRIHLIAVTSNSVKPAHAYFTEIGGPGSSGTLMHAFGVPDIDEGKRPFVVGDLDKKRPYVHVFDEETLDRVLSELGTIGDFVHYLTEKETAIRAGKLSLYAGEEELLAFYLQEQTPAGYGSLPFAGPTIAAGYRVNIPEGEWLLYTQSESYRVRSQMRKRAREWFELIEPFCKAVLAAETGEANETPLQAHEVALRVAASENLASRARLGTAFVEKYDSIPVGVRSSRMAPSICHPGRVYLFVFVPWIRQGVTYDEYRAYRLKVMEAYAAIAQLRFEGIAEAVVIGAQTADGSGTRSETMIYVKYDGPLSEEQSARLSEFSATEQILTDVQIRPHSVKSLHRYGRNDPCPCGSLKKNKKCCNISGPRHGTVYTSRLD